MSGVRHLRAIAGGRDEAADRRETGDAPGVPEAPDREPTERDLVDRSRRRDREAFGELFDRHHDAIFHYVLHRTADVALAQDLTAETFLRALRHLERFRWRRLPFSAWLYRIAANLCVDHYRRSRIRRALRIDQIVEPPASTTTAADFELLDAERRLGEHQSFLRLHRGIRRLAPRHQEVIVLRYFEHKSIDEISTITGKPAGTVKSWLHRGVGRLRVLLAEDGPQEEGGSDARAVHEIARESVAEEAP